MILESSMLKTMVLSFDDDNIEIRVLEVPDNKMQRYLDVDGVYKLFRHKHWNWNGDLLLWEIPGKDMKRSVSQVLLQWERGLGWCWEIEL